MCQILVKHFEIHHLLIIYGKLIMQGLAFNYIRHEVSQKGEIYADVARKMEVDPRTVSKYANQEEFKRKRKQKRKARVMDSVKQIVDKWIKEDLKKKKKYKRTAKKCGSSLKTMVKTQVI